MEYCISREELIQILAIATEMGFRKGLESLGEKCKYISHNQASKLLTRARLENFVKDGLIKPKINGNGKTSTKLYNVVELMLLDASNKIIIRKGYESKKHTAWTQSTEAR